MADADKGKKPEKGRDKPKTGKGRKLEESLAMVRGDFSKHKKVY